MKIGRYLVFGILILALCVAGFRAWRHETRRVDAAGMSDSLHYELAAYDTHAPANVRIKVEVLNATHRSGLARRATLYLRDRGFDVVDIGNAGRQTDSTIALDRSHHPEWAQLVAKTMHGREAERPDTSRYVDVTLLVGQDWSPPALPFYP